MGDPEIASRINSYELACRMQPVAPEIMDLRCEPQHVLNTYGAEPGKQSYANACLLTRRLLERGLLDDTLVVWGGNPAARPWSRAAQAPRLRPHQTYLSLPGGDFRLTDVFGEVVDKMLA